jgi:hypothetical protein
LGALGGALGAFVGGAPMEGAARQRGHSNLGGVLGSLFNPRQ